MTAGFLLQASALRDGAVSTVQTILTVELPLTVVLAAAVFPVSLSARKSAAIAGMTVGLAALLLFADPTPGSEHPTAADWLLTLPVTAGALTMLVILGSRSRDRRRAALLGAASGGCFGLTAVLIKAAEIRLPEGWVVPLTSWPTYLLVATGATSVYLFGRAVQAGQLATAQPGVTIADPLTATALGVVLFGDRIRAGWFLLGAPHARTSRGDGTGRPGGHRGPSRRRVDPSCCHSPPAMQSRRTPHTPTTPTTPTVTIATGTALAGAGAGATGSCGSALPPLLSRGARKGSGVSSSCRCKPHKAGCCRSPSG